jgi:hypothetical protein
MYILSVNESQIVKELLSVIRKSTNNPMGNEHHAAAYVDIITWKNWEKSGRIRSYCSQKEHGPEKNHHTL